jgi:hypothetical protein
MRPYIICHMLSSVDGKIDGAALSGVMPKGEYEATGAKLKGDAWICGRTTGHALASLRSGSGQDGQAKKKYNRADPEKVIGILSASVRLAGNELSRSSENYLR